MKHRRSIELLLSLRRLHESSALKRAMISENALRLAEKEHSDARTDLRNQNVAAIKQEREIIGGLRSKILSADSIQRAQDQIEASKHNSMLMAKKVAQLQSSTRLRARELDVARDHLRQKQKDVMKLEGFNEKLSELEAHLDMQIVEAEDDSYRSINGMDPFGLLERPSGDEQ